MSRLLAFRLRDHKARRGRWCPGLTLASRGYPERVLRLLRIPGPVPLASSWGPFRPATPSLPAPHP